MDKHIDQKLVEANLATWQNIISLYEHFGPTWQDHVEPYLRLVKAIAESERARYFRAGQAMTILMISTVPYHGLKDDDLFVRVFQVDRHPFGFWEKPLYFQVEYLRGVEVLKMVQCLEEGLIYTVDPFLDQLWQDTRGQDRPKKVDE